MPAVSGGGASAASGGGVSSLSGGVSGGGLSAFTGNVVSDPPGGPVAPVSILKAATTGGSGPEPPLPQPVLPHKFISAGGNPQPSDASTFSGFSTLGVNVSLALAISGGGTPVISGGGTSAISRGGMSAVSAASQPPSWGGASSLGGADYGQDLLLLGSRRGTSHGGNNSSMGGFPEDGGFPEAEYGDDAFLLHGDGGGLQGRRTTGGSSAAGASLSEASVPVSPRHDDLRSEYHNHEEAFDGDLSGSGSLVASRRVTSASDAVLPVADEMGMLIPSVSLPSELLSMPPNPDHPLGNKANTWGGSLPRQSGGSVPSRLGTTFGSHPQANTVLPSSQQPLSTEGAAEGGAELKGAQESDPEAMQGEQEAEDGPEFTDGLGNAVEEELMGHPAAERRLGAAGGRLISPGPSFGGHQVQIMVDQIREQLPKKV